MNKRKFKQLLKKYGYTLKRKGKHLIYSNGDDLFPLSSSGSQVNMNIIRVFEKKIGVKLI